MAREWEGGEKSSFTSGEMRKAFSSLDKAATGGTLYLCAAAFTKSSNVVKASAEASSVSTLASEMKMELS